MKQPTESRRYLARRVWVHIVRAALAALAVVLAFLAATPATEAQRARSVPEPATGLAVKPLARADRHMVAAAHPLAAEAGRDMLRRGGSATDAAVAALLVLNVVEPQSSGIGGGGFALVHEAGTDRLVGYDGRETAPAAAGPDRFLRGGLPMAFGEAVRSGRSVGVPGLVRLIAEMHAKHGRLSWAELFAPAVGLARDGFAVSPRLHTSLRWAGPQRFDSAARALFFDADGEPRATGDLIVNRALSETLERIARDGARAFYEGEVADAIIAAVADAPHSLGDLTRKDLATYRALEREPVCVRYRGRRVCGIGAPSSGGIAVAQTLKLIEPFAEIAGAAAALSPAATHLIAEAEKLAYADRDRFVADPAFADIPAGLLDDAYLAVRRRRIDAGLAMAKPAAGEPPGLRALTPGIDASRERAGTTHISVVDAEGNAVALTATIEGAFGSGIMAAGFLLNNELTDFSFMPVDVAGRAIANRVEGGKRPRSSMAPTIVFGAGGEVEVVLGSPGGNRIILFVVKALVGLLDWEMDAAGAAAIANFGSRGRSLELERDGRLWPLAAALAERGHRVVWDEMTSGLHIIVRKGGRLEGGADPRREGVALGD
ncbi:MAG: gamma-glutamyltransferase [Hyphomicrobiaceae bacterium]|nr:gamma-glutamyltransferase [Hyphomicrobiaceae bacterium]